MNHFHLPLTLTTPFNSLYRITVKCQDTSFSCMPTATLHGCLSLPSHPGMQTPVPWSENYASGLPYMAYPKKSALMVDNHIRPMKCRHFWPLGACPTGCHLPTTHNPMAELKMLWKPPNGCFMTTSPMAVSTQTASLVPSSNIGIHLYQK